MNNAEVDKSDEFADCRSRDTLTGLPNRAKLKSELKSKKTDSMLIFVDINDFGSINNLYGEEIGNEILKETAKKLKNFINENEAELYKFHGDQYAILVKEKEFFDKYLYLAKYSLLTSESYSEVNGDLYISYTVGISYGCDELFHKANIALREAKRRKVDLLEYKAELNIEQRQKENIKRLKTFKEALQNDNIVPFFQPIVDAKTKETIKYEAVARLIGKNGEIISPDMFLDVAKQSRLSRYLSRQIMQKIFRIASKNDEEISINLVYDDIACKETLLYIKNRLELHGKRNITFELVESEEIVDYGVIESFIKMAKSYGCKISIDDFGSGYSNFSYLFKLDIDYLKIDGSIIQKLLVDDKSKKMVIFLVDFARINNIKIIAEFVSSDDIADELTKLGVDYLQGFSCGKPQRAEYYGL